MKRDGHIKVVKVHKHKTSRQAAVRLHVSKRLQQYFRCWLKHIRPTLPTDHDYFLSEYSGAKVGSKHHSDHVKRFAKTIGKPVPSATFSRKINSAVSSTLSDEKKSSVAALMSHSPATAERHYRRLGAAKSYKDAFLSLGQARKDQHQQLVQQKRKREDDSDDGLTLPKKKKKRTVISSSDEDKENQPMKIESVVLSVTPTEERVISSKQEITIKIEPACTPIAAKQQGPVDPILLSSTSAPSSTDDELYRPTSPPALPVTFYTPGITRRLRLPKPTPPVKKGKRRFSSAEERAIVERVPLRPGLAPATSLFRPVPSPCKIMGRTPADCRDKWRNMAKSLYK